MIAQNLNELMKEHNISVKALKKIAGLKTTSVIYEWLSGKRGIKLDKAVKIADFFQCSLDYLAGLTDNYEEKTYLPCPPFKDALLAVMQEKNITQYKLMKETNFKGGNIYTWFNKNATPRLDTVVELANFFDVTLDHLVGRE